MTSSAATARLYRKRPGYQSDLRVRAMLVVFEALRKEFGPEWTTVFSLVLRVRKSHMRKILDSIK